MFLKRLEMRTCRGITKKITFCRKPTGGKWLCYQHRRQPIYFIVVALTGVFFSYISGFLPKPKFYLRWENNIYASPSSVTLYKGDWFEKTRITVWNRRDKPVYSVWVKIGVVGEGVTSESININIPPKSSMLEGHVGNFFVSGDTYGISAIDSSGHEAVYIVIHTIQPASYIEFIVSGSIPVQSHATVKVLSFSATQETMQERENASSFNFKPPENMKIKGIGLIMRKGSQ